MCVCVVGEEGRREGAQSVRWQERQRRGLPLQQQGWNAGRGAAGELSSGAVTETHKRNVATPTPPFPLGGGVVAAAREPMRCGGCFQAHIWRHARWSAPCCRIAGPCSCWVSPSPCYLRLLPSPLYPLFCCGTVVAARYVAAEHLQRVCEEHSLLPSPPVHVKQDPPRSGTEPRSNPLARQRSPL